MTDRAELVIEKGIPIPEAHNHSVGAGRTFGQQAILRKMEVGDSVLLGVGFNAANSAARQAFGHNCFAVRREGSGVRLWRTK